jgi:hypothetical protein
VVAEDALSLAVVLHHTPWRPERVKAAAAMLKELRDGRADVRIHDRDYRQSASGLAWQQGGKLAWQLCGWDLGVRSAASHVLYLTDDLHLAPRFLEVVRALIACVPDAPIGLLSNHPKATALAAEGDRWYRTNSWLVGPAYVMPREKLMRFVAWFERLPEHRRVGEKSYNDDSAINEWVTNGGGGGETYHPIPTPIEHRADLESTVGHGDEYSRERVSWRHPVFAGLAPATLTDERFWRDAGEPRRSTMLRIPSEGG